MWWSVWGERLILPAVVGGLGEERTQDFLGDLKDGVHVFCIGSALSSGVLDLFFAMP